MSGRSSEDSIHAAACRGDLEAVRTFVEVEEVDIDIRDKKGCTPLISATFASKDCNPGVAGVIRYLIAKNANVEAATTHQMTEVGPGSTALMAASRQGKLEAAKILLEVGHANANYSRPMDGATPLVLATYFTLGNCVVPTLLQHGANPNPILCTSTEYKTPLLNAIKHHCSSKMVHQLLKYGANLKEDGDEAICFIARNPNDTTIRLLILQLSLQLNPNDFKTALSLCFRHMVHACDVITIDADNLGIVLDHCREAMSGDEFADLLLSPLPHYPGYIFLHRTRQIQVAKLLIEQPRGDNNQLLPVCQQQLVQQDDHGLTPLGYVNTRISLRTQVEAYLETFESLVLSIPSDVESRDNVASATKRRKLNDCVAVRLNPELNDFQRSVAQESLDLIMETVESIPDSVGHAILGYLSVLDVMKRSD